MLDSLTRDGVVERHASSSDRRAVIVRLKAVIEEL
jgi:DNA-binding MarR family transcriptional regulator